MDELPCARPTLEVEPATQAHTLPDQASNHGLLAHGSTLHH